MILKNGIKAVRNCNLFRIKFEPTTQNNSEKMKNFVPVFAILVAVLLLGLNCDVKPLPMLTDYFVPNAKILEICTNGTGVKLNSSSDIFCMLDPEKPLCRKEQCVLECIVRLQDMQETSAILHYMIRKLESGELSEKDAPNDRNFRLLALLVQKCKVEISPERSDRLNDRCFAAYQSLLCMRNHEWAGFFIRPNPCP